MPTDPSTPTVILVGAGHAHLHIASRAADYRAQGARLVLIDPGRFWYSGMATGLLGGQYSAADDQVDPARLIEHHGGTFIRDEVTAVDPHKRMVTLASGRALRYDWLSLNVGSEVHLGKLSAPDGGPSVWPVKPIPPLHTLRRELESAMAARGRMPHVVVVGGGATGSELAANLAALTRRHAVAPCVTLVSRSSAVLPQAPAQASAKLQRVLNHCSVTLRLATSVTQLTTGGVQLDDGTELPCDHVVAAVGLQAKALTQALGLPASRDGLRVCAQMHSVDDPRIFAAGDCADYAPRRLPKLGVFGVRAAAVIHQNLLASLAGQPLKPYQPQRRWLAILNLGDGRGLLLWWRLWWLGRSSAWLKNRIDQRFMRQFRV